MTPFETALLSAAGLGWVLLGFAVRLLFKGELVTRREHTESLSQHQGLVSTLQERLKVTEDLNAQLAGQNDLLMSSAIPTVNTVLNALHQAAGDDAR